MFWRRETKNLKAHFFSSTFLFSKERERERERDFFLRLLGTRMPDDKRKKTACTRAKREFSQKKRNKNYTDERMKPSPSYAGPIVTSLATVFAASGACLYAVNVQKIFGGMPWEKERAREKSFCLDFVWVFTLLKICFIFIISISFGALFCSRCLSSSFVFIYMNNNDQITGSTPSTITNTEWLAATEASFQNGVEREGAPGKPIAVNPMSRNVSPWTTKRINAGEREKERKKEGQN